MIRVDYLWGGCKIPAGERPELRGAVLFYTAKLRHNGTGNTYIFDFKDANHDEILIRC